MNSNETLKVSHKSQLTEWACVSDTARSDKRVNARHVVSTPESTGGWQGRACVHAPQGSPAGAWGAQGQNPESQGQSKERKRSSRAAQFTEGPSVERLKFRHQQEWARIETLVDSREV